MTVLYFCTDCINTWPISDQDTILSTSKFGLVVTFLFGYSVQHVLSFVTKPYWCVYAVK